MNKQFNIDNSYLTLNEKMHKLRPFSNSYQSALVLLNEDLANELEIDIDYLKSDEGIKILSGNKNETIKTGYTQSYAGHQYGHFTNLGDGRTMMIGEHIVDGKRIDIQLKGSGKTEYSRSGDGLATMYSMLREYLISEAMHHLNVPTTRSLAVIDTDDWVNRMGLKKRAILTRTATSHIRVGTFEYAKSIGGKELVEELADYTIDRHFKHLNGEDNKYILFFEEVMERQIKLLVKWQSIGFIHGVLNTDNILISGETIDYGPCAFMNTYNPKTVFSSIDQNGRYRYESQPYIGSWNMARFSETLLELIADTPQESVTKVNAILSQYGELYYQEWLKLFGSKLGILDVKPDDKVLIDSLFTLMELHEEDFTNTFRLLTIGDYRSIKMYQFPTFQSWIKKWETRIEQIDFKERIQIMKEHNPYIIPRNHLVEEALLYASKYNDYSYIKSLYNKLKRPYHYDKDLDMKYLESTDKAEYKTYCGT